MSTWDEVKQKIQNLEKDPFLDADMLRTMDSISIADYWRRRFEEEHALSERKLGGKDEEVRQLKDRLERQSVDLRMVHQELDAARTQLLDKQRYWEERHHGLELENRSMKDRMEWEVKSRVLEEQNRFLAGRLSRGLIDEPEPAEAPAPKTRRREGLETSEETQALRAQLSALQQEKQKWEEDQARLAALVQQVGALRQAKAEAEARADASEADTAPLKKENDRLQKQLQPLAEQFNRLKKYMEDREKEHLLALEDLGRGFAHRVRNYLGIMSGTLQLCLSNFKMEPELQEQVTLVDQNAQEMLKAIEEFLSLVRVPEMGMEPVNLNEFLGRAMMALEDKAKAANVKLQWDLAEGLPSVMGDTRLLGEAVSALALNSLEAMPEGGRLGIETSFDASDHGVKVVFKDTGKGINENHIRKVFQPYFTSKKGAKGLGLTVCKRVMELHRGTLSLESVKGEGTTVILSFPADNPPPDQK